MSEKTFQCARCGSTVPENKIKMVDDTHVCVKCMFCDTEPIEIYPIGFVKNDLQRNPEGFGVIGNKDHSRIELFPTQEPFMYRLEDERYICVVYHLHEHGNIRSVFERGLDGKEVGVFASRTPHRLNPVAIQNVDLLKIEGTVLHVKGLDAINGSPVLDIKMQWSSV